MAAQAQPGANLKRMKLAVVSHKPCWRSALSPSGYATDGGFPFQMRALSEIFAAARLLAPVAERASAAGEIPLDGDRIEVVPLTALHSRGWRRKLALPLWLARNSMVILREVVAADAVHAPIPGDVGTIGMLIAVLLRKPLLVRHCGNWLVQRTAAEHFWKWFMERFAGGRNVMLATGGSDQAPSEKNSNIEWIFSSSLREQELADLPQTEMRAAPAPRLVIACRQEREKGTGVAIAAMPSILLAFPEATLDVIGDGGALEEFRALATALDVQERVFFHGKVNHARVLELLRTASVFCYPTSASEGFPKVVLEALACGLPVIATRVSVLPQLLASGCGVLLEKADSEELAAAAGRCLAGTAVWQRMSERARETARQYSLERWRDTIAEKVSAAWGPHALGA